MKTQSSISSLLTKTEKPSVSNYFHNYRPEGIIIQDTYNNNWFPIPEPKIDTFKSWLPKIRKQFQTLYSKFKLHNLPWHFTIEVINGEYTVYNTRPINRKFPIEEQHRRLNTSQCIHICIIGDTESDIYTPGLYRIIGENCISPFFKIMKTSPIINKTIITINIGSKFNINLLDSYITK